MPIEKIFFRSGEMENNTNSFNEKKKKKLTLLVIAMLVCILACIIVASSMFGITLARYQTLGTGEDKDMPIAKWGVTTDVKDTLHIQSNQYVVDGKLAPATEGYVDVKIKLDGTEVAVDYEITIGDMQLTGGTLPTTLTVKKVATRNADNSADDTTLTGTEDAGNKITTYSGTIALQSGAAFAANYEFIVRIYVEWENDEAQNTNDTALGNLADADREVTFSLKVDAKQHIA